MCRPRLGRCGPSGGGGASVDVGDVVKPQKRLLHGAKGVSKTELIREASDKMANAVHQMLREVMDIRQASDYLGVSADTLYRYASEGFIPAFKLGNRWRFKRSLLDSWMVDQSGARGDAGVSVMLKQKKPVRRVK